MKKTTQTESAMKSEKRKQRSFFQNINLEALQLTEKFETITSTQLVLFHFFKIVFNPHIIEFLRNEWFTDFTS